MMKCLLIFGVAFATFYTCFSEFPEYCQSPPDEGVGSTIKIFIYYDAARGICQPFRYLGEGGNDNRFTNERECMRNCSDKAHELYPTDASMICRLPKAQGDCIGSYLRFYYDPIHDKCKSFFWTGCVGNGNRFLDQKICNATCDGIHDEGEGDEEDEYDTPFGLIAGILFGIIGAIILILVIVLAVQSKGDSKKKPKKSEQPQTEAPLQEEGIEMA